MSAEPVRKDGAGRSRSWRVDSEEPAPIPPMVVLDRWVGRTLAGRYRIETKLASGGYATVYRGTQLSIRRPVAIKLLHSRFSTNPRQLKRFEREASALSSLRHPGIVRVVDSGQVPGEQTLFLVMELLEGQTLAARLRDSGPFEPEAVIDVGLSVLDALTEAHEQGVVHRDLKPDNIFLAHTRRGEQVKLLDFGIAKVSQLDGDSVLTHTGMVLGSPRYLSPEQACDLPITGQTDIYSLGAVLYELLLDQPAFTRRSPGEHIAAHILDRPDPPRRRGCLVGGRLIATLLRFMAKEPEERPRGARHAAALLESCRGEVLREIPDDLREGTR